MINILPIYQSKQTHARRESEREYLIRMAQLREGAEPSAGDPAADFTSEAPYPAAGESKVSEATAGPPVNPPSHGDPTNPAQPR